MSKNPEVDRWNETNLHSPSSALFPTLCFHRSSNSKNSLEKRLFFCADSSNLSLCLLLRSCKFIRFTFFSQNKVRLATLAIAQINGVFAVHNCLRFSFSFGHRQNHSQFASLQYLCSF